MVAGEHQRDEHAGDFIGGEPEIAVVAGDRHQYVEHVPVGLVFGRVGDPAFHDLAHQSDQTFAGLVTNPEALDRQVGIDITEWVGATLEQVIEIRETRIELLAELAPDQTGRRGVDGQFGEEVQQVDFAGLAPVLDGPADLALDSRSVTLHMVTAKRGVVQHLLAAFRAGVEDDTRAEDGRHERVGLRLVQVFIGGAEEEFVRVLTGQQDHVFIGELEGADIPALVTKPAHQADRVGAELLEVPVLFGAAGDAPNFLQWCGASGHGSSGYLSCCRSMGALVSGASG